MKGRERASRQSDEHWNCFRGNVGEASERRGRSHMGFSERTDTIVVIVVFDKSNTEWTIFDIFVFDVCVCTFCRIFGHGLIFVDFPVRIMQHQS